MNFKFGQGLPSLDEMPGGSYTPPKAFQPGQMAVQKFQLPKQNVAMKANDLSNKKFQTKVAQQIDQAGQAPAAPGTGMMQGAPTANPGGMPSKQQMAGIPAMNMMGHAGTPTPAEMQMGAAAADALGSPYQAAQDAPQHVTGVVNPSHQDGHTARVAQEVPPGAISADVASRLAGSDESSGLQGELADMLSNSDAIYEQDQRNVDRLIAKLQRRAASTNAMSGATGSGGFHMAGDSAAYQSGINAAQQAAAAHAGRQIDLQMSVLEKQIAQAEAAKDRGLERELRDQWEALERDRMSLENPEPPLDDESSPEGSSSGAGSQSAASGGYGSDFGWPAGKPPPSNSGELYSWARDNASWFGKSGDQMTDEERDQRRAYMAAIQEFNSSTF